MRTMPVNEQWGMPWGLFLLFLELAVVEGRLASSQFFQELILFLLLLCSLRTWTKP